MRRWPDTLPGIIRPGYQLQPVDPALRTDMEVGARRLRRLTRARRDMVAVAWLFDDDQMAAFRAWFGDEPWSLAGDSEALTGWALTNATTVQDGVVGPAGQLADKLRATADSGAHHATRSLTGAGVDNQMLVITATLRAAGLPVGRLGYTDRAGVLRYADVTLASGAVAGQSGLTSATVTDRGNGWWRVTLTGSTGAGAAVPEMRLGTLAVAGVASFAGDASSGLYASEKMARLQTGTDLFLMTDAQGYALGAAGGTAWFLTPLAFGGGWRDAEVRFDGGWQADVGQGLRWNVKGKLEVRNA